MEGKEFGVELRKCKDRVGGDLEYATVPYSIFERRFSELNDYLRGEFGDIVLLGTTGNRPVVFVLPENKLDKRNENIGLMIKDYEQEVIRVGT